jgi:SAM-dependent methyltransferase
MLKQLVPSRIKDSIKVLLGRAQASPLTADLLLENQVQLICPVCSSSIQKFDRLSDYYYENLDKNGYIFSPFQAETLNRLQYSCPTCGASDRDRLYALYFKKEMPQVQDDFYFLDIAPAGGLQDFLKVNYPTARYRSADLEIDTADDRIDITQMNIYDEKTFDFFICSHVLEHIEDDRKAMSELFRVLKPGGKGIAMVPIMLSLEEDYENPEVKTPEARWKHFGQDDHVRMYSKNGFLSKLASTGFQVHQLNASFFGLDVFTQYGIHPRSVLYIVEKPSRSFNSHC